MSTKCTEAAATPSDPYSYGFGIALAVIVTTVASALLLLPENSVTQEQASTSLNLGMNAHGDSTGFETGEAGEPYRFDHSVVNSQNLPAEPNPAPMAVAAYE